MRALFAVVAMSAACTPFTAAPTTGTEPGALPEAGAFDGGADASPLCRSFFCESFDPGWETRWQKFPDPSIALNATTTGSPRSPSLRLLLQPGTGPSARQLLFIDLPNVGRVVASMSMRVVKRGNGEIDLFGLAATPDNGAPGHYLVHRGADGSFGIEAASMTMSPVPQTFEAWTRVVIDVDKRTRAYSFTLDGTVGASGTTPTAVDSAVLVLGASFVQDCTMPWEVVFDDVDVVVVP